MIILKLNKKCILEIYDDFWTLPGSGLHRRRKLKTFCQHNYDQEHAVSPGAKENVVNLETLLTFSPASSALEALRL